jgi:bacterioferritin
MASQKLLDMMQDAVVREMTVSIQYMWQHITIKGMYAEAVGPVFRVTALAEMLHAELIAERLEYLGGTLPMAPTTVNVGGKARQMIENDVKAEEEAIAFYREIIKLAAEEDDSTTKKLFEDILRDEEGHHNLFTGLLEE